MRLVPYASLAAFAALSCMASEGAGGAADPPADPPVTDPPADPPKDPPADPPKDPPSPKDPPATKAKAPKKVFVIWCAPGHADFGVGQMVRSSPDMAEALRAAGRARLASKEEIEVFKDRDAEIPDVD